MRLLDLYPRAWRERYGPEMLALLEQHDVTLATRLDLLRGAWDAWTQQRRYLMASLPAAAWRGARIGLIPSLFPLAQYLLSLDLNADTTLLNLLWFMAPASLAALVLACLWAGKREAERTGGRRGSLVAGAAAGVVGLLASIIVHDGLLVGDLAFGISSHLIALQGGSISTDMTAASVAGSFVRTSSLLFDAILVLVGISVGAALGLLGAAFRGLRVTREPSSA